MLENQTCIIVGASHGGVSAAFALRKEGWLGKIIMIDADPALPYHRPPLSKAYLLDCESTQPAILKPKNSYEKAKIELKLGETVETLDNKNNEVSLTTGETLRFDRLIIATGASAFIPPINGLEHASNIYTLRTAADVLKIKKAFNELRLKRVVIIGGGYIGLETAASLKKLGGDVSVLEREDRLLARVTSTEMSDFFNELHTSNGVDIRTSQNVVELSSTDNVTKVTCEDTSTFEADIVIIGVGVRVNQTLAVQANIECDNGIKVNNACQTSAQHIYAIGDCSYHYNTHYNRWMRLESVQNAVDQGKVAAANICEKTTSYNTIPWFWSDQFDIKLQMVGLSAGYTEQIIRKEPEDKNKFSVWYFKGDELLSVDAVNHAKAYVLATKLLKQKANIDKQALLNSEPLTIDLITAE